MIRVAALAVLAGGIVLLVMGMEARNSFHSDVSRLLTGSSSDRAVWMLTAGVVMTVLGAGGLAFGSKRGK